MAQKRKKSKVEIVADAGLSEPLDVPPGPMNGRGRAMPEEASEMDAAGRSLRNAAERHGEATRRLCHDALSSVLEAAHDDGPGVGKAAKSLKSVAEKLAKATRDAEINLR